MQPPSADFGMELWSAEVIRVLDFSRYCITPPLHYSMVEGCVIGCAHDFHLGAGKSATPGHHGL